MGFNYRLSNLLAALGRVQLSRLDEMIAKRRELRQMYRELFEDVDGVTLFDGGSDEDDNCWLTSILVDPEITGWTKAELSEHLQQENIESRPLWKPMHLQPMFKNTEALGGKSSQQLFENGLTLPSGSVLTGEQVDFVCSQISEFLKASK